MKAIVFRQILQIYSESKNIQKILSAGIRTYALPHIWSPLITTSPGLRL